MYHVKVQENISYNMLPTSHAVKKNCQHHAVCEIDLLFCFCVYRRDCKRDASALLTDLTQQNTGKSSPLPYPAGQALTGTGSRYYLKVQTLV